MSEANTYCTRNFILIVTEKSLKKKTEIIITNYCILLWLQQIKLTCILLLNNFVFLIVGVNKNYLY